jgi:hypothetical protein
MSTDISEVRAAPITRGMRALMMEAARIYETSVDIDLTAHQYIPEDSELNKLDFTAAIFRSSQRVWFRLTQYVSLLSFYPLGTDLREEQRPVHVTVMESESLRSVGQKYN